MNLSTLASENQVRFVIGLIKIKSVLRFGRDIELVSQNIHYSSNGGFATKPTFYPIAHSAVPMQS